MDSPEKLEITIKTVPIGFVKSAASESVLNLDPCFSTFYAIEVFDQKRLAHNRMKTIGHLYMGSSSYCALQIRVPAV